MLTAIGRFVDRIRGRLGLNPPMDCALWIAKARRRAETRASPDVPGRYVIANYSLGPGGAERQIYETIRGLVSLGHTDGSVVCVDLSTHSNAAFFASQIRDLGIGLIDLQDVAKESGRRRDALLEALPPRLVGLVDYFATVLEKIRPSCVYGWQDEVGVAISLAAIYTGVPRIVVSLRSLGPTHYTTYGRNDLYLAPYFRALLTAGDVTLVANAVAVARDYENWLQIKAGSIQINANSFEWCFEMARSSPRIEPSVLVVGAIMRLSAEKRPELFVEAAAIVARERGDVRFILAGTGPLKDVLTKKIAALDISERFRLMGLVDRPEAVLSDFSVLVQTSSIEGLPNVIGEAQALQIPVVATDVGGTRELLIDGVTGFVCSDASPNALARRILRVLDDPAWRLRAGSEAARNIRERFGRQAMTERTIRLLGL